ncbi:MAG: hypothetical protein ACK4V6_19325, partial [Microthrixaceae bacterium]
MPTSTTEVSEASQVASPVGRAPSDRGLATWSTDWPLTLLVVGFPLWWALGLASIMPVLVAVPMAVHLFRRHPIRMPDGFGWWLIFLACVVLSVTMLFVDAPSAVPGGGPSRLIVFTYRLLWYVSCGIVLLWIANRDERELPTLRVVRLMSWMFIVTVLGGLLGVLAPNLEFTSAVEAVLPGGLRSNAFVRSLVHPASAAVQSILGTASPRPIAPFAFANSWGANLSMFLPFFLVGWLGRDAGWRRSVAPVVLVLVAVPIVLSLNRGLWLSLALGVVYYVVRLVLRGRMVALVGAVIVVAVAGVVFLASPLGEMTANRLETPHSNDRRGELLTTTVTSTAEGSPVLGFGSTRDVQGSFASIAGGATPDCPACTVPPLGTQGQIWLVLFSQGFVGLLAFLAFFGGQFTRHWRSRTTVEAIGVCLLLFFGLQLFVYDTLGMPMYTMMIAIGLMWRERTRLSPRSWSGVTLESTAARVRASWRLIGVCVVLGAVLGGVVATRWTPTYAATAPVLLQAAPVYLDPLATEPAREITIDTEASMVYAEETIARVRDELDLDDEPDLRDSVRVTAPANTRVLRITVIGDDPDRAAATADALAASYLQVRGEYLDQRREQVRRQLQEQLEASAGLGLVESVETEDAQGVPVGDVLVEEELRRQLADLALGTAGAGRLLRPAETERLRPPIEVPVVSGALIG